MNDKTGARPSDPPAKPAVKKAAPKPQTERPIAHRAGGWIDRGDGRGWELEKE